MKLYITEGSAYARMARIVVLEKDLARRVQVIVARTRAVDSPYYTICPSGRVPFLIDDDGIGMEESALICAFLDQADGHPTLELPVEPDPWEGRRMEGHARSMLDGVSVWLREISRPRPEQSPAVIQHEAARSARMLALWERQCGHRLLHGPLNMLQITLACALGLAVRMPGFDWRHGHPQLVRWFEHVASRPSFVGTTPPRPA